MASTPGAAIAVVFDRAAVAESLADLREAEPTLGPRAALAGAGRFVKHAPVDQLQQSLKALTGSLAALLTDVKAVGGFELAEVQVGVELTAEGGVNLIGNLTAGARGAMQLTFKPASTASSALTSTQE